jgi:hypothetical protein
MGLFLVYIKREIQKKRRGGKTKPFKAEKNETRGDPIYYDCKPA